MTKFTFLVTVDTDTYEHAMSIMEARIDFEERYYITPQDELVGRDDSKDRDYELDYDIQWDGYPDPFTTSPTDDPNAAQWIDAALQ